MELIYTFQSFSPIKINEVIFLFVIIIIIIIIINNKI